MKTYGRLSGDRAETDYAQALETGFRSGDWKAALRKGLDVQLAQRKTGYASPFGIASLYAELGDNEQALRWLNTAYEERDFYMETLNIAESFDGLRSDPRFKELVRKVGLPN